MKFWRRRAARESRKRRRASEDAPKSTLEALRATKTDRAVQRLTAAETARVRPSDDALDTLAEISDEDITHAIESWDVAQEAADTGLAGLLDARVGDDA